MSNKYNTEVIDNINKLIKYSGYESYYFNNYYNSNFAGGSENIEAISGKVDKYTDELERNGVDAKLVKTYAALTKGGCVTGGSATLSKLSKMKQSDFINYLLNN